MSATQQERLEDQYRLYRLYLIDLDSARHTLKIMRRYRKLDTRFCLLRDALIAYCRPFSGNVGLVHKKHQLSEQLVPLSSRPLHRELRSRRNQLVAHTDVEARKPQFARWGTDPTARIGMAFRHGDWAGLDRRVAEIESLVRSVVAALAEKTIQLERQIS